MTQRAFEPAIAPRWRERVLAIVGECSCHPGYRERAMVDPFCPFHEYAAEISDALAAAFAEGQQVRDDK